MSKEKSNIDNEVSLPHKYFCKFGKEIYIYKEVTSTNRIAQLLAQSGAPEGTIVLSRSQTSGRGRMKRQWSCPPGKGILMSIVLRPPIKIQFVPQLTLLCSVVVAETIRKVTGCAAGIKWPNDILIGEKKVCGILAQSSFSGAGQEYVIIGVGINVNLSKDQLPLDCRKTSTSLKLELGQEVSRAKLLEQFYFAWEEHYLAFLESGHAYLREKWFENNVTLGRKIVINRNTYPYQGLAVDINDQGGLIVDFEDGSTEEFLAEELSLNGSYSKN